MDIVFLRPTKFALLTHCIFGISCFACGFVYLWGHYKTGAIILGFYFLGFAAFIAIKGDNKIVTLEQSCLRFNVDGKHDISVDLTNIENMSISEIDKFIPNPNTIHPNKVPTTLPVLKIQLKNSIEIINESIKTKVTRSVPLLNNWELTPDLRTIHIFQRPKGGFENFIKIVTKAIENL